MKSTKGLIGKLLTLAIALVMTLAFTAVPAKADNVDVSGHTFKAYKIFKADFVTTETNGTTELTGLAWGEGVAAEAQTALLTAGGNATDVDALAKYLTSANDEQVKAFSDAVIAQKAKLGTPTTVTSGTTKLPLGYYLITDESDATTITAVNKALLYVSTDADVAVTVASKVEVPTSFKKVKDINDSEGTTMSGWQDTADWDIGDDVPFQLTATLPGNYSDYKDYHFTFHDKECAGLGAPENVVVKMGDTVLTANTNYTFVAPTTDNDSFDITFSAVQLARAKATNGATITVEYTAKLNGSAKIGQEGNPNTSWITFNNDVNSEGTGTDKPENGKTPHDTAIVFTYKAVFNKVDENNKPLSGASFTLLKKVTEGYTGAGKKTGAVVKSELTTANSKVDVSGIDDHGYYVVLSTQETTPDTTFTFNGIDDGTYVLVETNTPDGYNPIKNQSFNVTATHADGEEVDFGQGAYKEGTSGKNGNGDYVLTELNGTKVNGTITLDGTAATGVVHSDIQNKSGSTLPTTGGMGTTIFYVVGTVLVLGAGAVLISRKRSA